MIRIASLGRTMNIDLVMAINIITAIANMRSISTNQHIMISFMEIISIQISNSN